MITVAAFWMCVCTCVHSCVYGTLEMQSMEGMKVVKVSQLSDTQDFSDVEIW